ncbi:hypothetical protein [Candidatus Oleimmundimicrobium sp.]|uniref:hypothetical protein n=1 Tax=Candidatus Oleimmundimicrobium sp. TaxID=3060597 RepID=UPI002715C60B|nr:hypothetical protein [Candidatus Oleimmundimicrobium sp.]MDO8885742.1 hypothetical protein [Candidatus Oleimmundimicrobium sp.]
MGELKEIKTKVLEVTYKKGKKTSGKEWVLYTIQGEGKTHANTFDKEIAKKVKEGLIGKDVVFIYDVTEDGLGGSKWNLQDIVEDIVECTETATEATIALGQKKENVDWDAKEKRDFRGRCLAYSTSLASAKLIKLEAILPQALEFLSFIYEEDEGAYTPTDEELNETFDKDTKVDLFG